MGVTLSFLSDALKAPVISLFILISLWIFIKTKLGDYDVRWFQLSYRTIVEERKYYLIMSSLFYYSSTLHFLQDITVLWSLRIFEESYGTFFFLRYTIVFILFQIFVFITLFNWVLKSSIHSAQYNAAINTMNFSFSSMILAWLCFFSTDTFSFNHDLVVYEFGLIPIPLSIAPIVIILILYFLVPVSHNFSHFIGFIEGYLLSLGFLQILPNIFWTICISIDLILFLVWLKFSRPLIMQDETTQNNGDVFDVSILSHQLNSEDDRDLESVA